jgi:hypothetical protein
VRYDYVAFVRAVNLGNANVLPKEKLRAAFLAAGASRAETYLASGNVLFSAPQRELKTLPTRLRPQLRKHELDQPVAIVPLATLLELKQRNFPSPSRVPGAKYLGVFASFLSEPPSHIPALPRRSPRGELELFAVHVSIALTHRHRFAAHPPDANAFAERILGVPATTRAWSTVLRLVDKFASLPTQ